ncbi:riboflavin synthase [Thermosyntropha sp.]|uniref:riboflavin synthase n=1 Tax=Thermosyntropha sp. TaxID=2740820 RepID=UPI0025EECFA7|nr:riboflavin synthase [Thermosyntropha sp.]MBO8158507.1 riboflavin synthase [Thermosyntropha sp.]
MFTGIVEELGVISRIQPGTQSFKLTVKAHKVLEDVKTGDSIAVNGVCLTVTQFVVDYFTADVMPETVEKTNLKYLKSGDFVNLERALRLGDRLGGHLVQGHVDAVGEIIKKEAIDIAFIYYIKAPDNVLKYTVPKGSIAIDGISLTVVDVFNDGFTVSLIPHTAQMTTLGLKKAGDKVNLESDIIGRYVEKLLRYEGRDEKVKKTLDLNFLSENGFI